MLPLRARVDMGVMAMKGYSAFPKAPALLEPSGCLMSYLGHAWWGRGSYPSVEVQSVYTITSANRATGHSLVGGVLPLYREAVGEFYNLLQQREQRKKNFFRLFLSLFYLLLNKKNMREYHLMLLIQLF